MSGVLWTVDARRRSRRDHRREVDFLVGASHKNHSSWMEMFDLHRRWNVKRTVESSIDWDFVRHENLRGETWKADGEIRS